jgi:hypothetical protein
MKLRTPLQLLRRALDDFYVAACNVELDLISHRAGFKRNKATSLNLAKLEIYADEVRELFEFVRADAASNPTPSKVRQLRQCERGLRIWDERFGPTFDPQPSSDLRSA